MTKTKPVRNKIFLENYFYSNNRCEYCGKEAKHVHHIFKRHFRSDEKFCIVSACLDCHKNSHPEKFKVLKEDEITINNWILIKYKKGEIGLFDLETIREKLTKKASIDYIIKYIKEKELNHVS